MQGALGGGWLGWLFRPQCGACGAPGPTPCRGCAVLLLELGPACPRCADPEDGEAVCARCEDAPLPLDRIVAPWRFGGPLASAIRRLKFAGRTHIARDLAPLWAPLVAAASTEAAAEAMGPAAPGAAPAIVVPVPLHWRRRLARGYDQAWLLARYACAEAGLPPPVPALRRTRAARPQSTLSAAERRTNLTGAFEVRRGAVAAIAGRGIVLVDDVVTTGETMAEAARALRAAGARYVIGVAVARAS